MMMTEEKKAPEWPLLKLYDLISGPADHERPWEEVSSLFLPGARIRMEIVGEDGSTRSCDWSVDSFAKEAAEHYRRAGFWEREIARKTERFGNIAHIFSTYESRVGDPKGPPATRGINSVQVLRRGEIWRIAGIVFQIELSDTPIPSEYF
jgi:hypothetical protein